LGFGVQGSGFRVFDVGSRVSDSGWYPHLIQGLGLRIGVSGFRV